MKTQRFHPSNERPGLRVSLSIILGLLASLASYATVPRITSIHLEGTNVVVNVAVPEGTRRVTLESRTRFGAANWEPRAVCRQEQRGSLVFRLPVSKQMELLRVRADAVERLPSSFYTGTTNFAESDSGAYYGPQDLNVYGRMDTDAMPPGAETREVVESDIWKVRGNTVYFFNQYRGLQVIDLTNPDAPVVRSTLHLPGAGEDMYLLGDNHVVLLATLRCYTSDASQIVIVADTNPTPAIVTSLEIPGRIIESRLVGTALYVASQTYRQNLESNYWEWGIAVSSFDLSNPSAPVARDTAWFSGYGNVVTATDRLLFVASTHPTNWWQSVLQCLDITAPDGTMHPYVTVVPGGRINDKFKIQYAGDVLTTIAEDWRMLNGTRVVTRLETFRVPDPRSDTAGAVTRLGELVLGQNEQLFATRFDGNRVYIVTFLRVDPLWVVDLSNPGTPRVAGELEVPGWSTYIQPLANDRLIAVGTETNRVAVSLFDVRDPARPALLSKVRLGENWSYSEANYDEKAFTVIPEANLVLLPFRSDNANYPNAAVQLIDLGPDTLTVRGVIGHEMHPRRATLVNDRVVSISGWELLTVDATDRDNPLVRGRLALTWQVDQVFLAGDYLVELASWGSWYASVPPEIRIAPANNPDAVLFSLMLSNSPIQGSTVRGDKLYLMQSAQNISQVNGSNVIEPTLRLSIYSLANLPQIELLGEASAPLGLPFPGYGGEWHSLFWVPEQYQPLWPNPNTLVWRGGQSYGRFALDLPLVSLDSRFAPSLIWGGPYWGGYGGNNLIAFDVSNPTNPAFASTTNPAPESMSWNSSPALTTPNLVYVSYQTWEFVEGLVSPWMFRGSTNVYTNTTTGEVITNQQPAGTSVTRNYLSVVDYTDAQAPVVRQPVNIPGKLTGLSHQGEVLYTVGRHWTTNTAERYVSYLDAVAYDGVNAHLITSLSFAENWAPPISVMDTNIYISRAAKAAAAEPAEDPQIETWFLSQTGQFVRAHSLPVPDSIALLTAFDGFLGARTREGRLLFFDVQPEAPLRIIGQDAADCLYYQLDRGAGSRERGFWLPAGSYAVKFIPFVQ